MGRQKEISEVMRIGMEQEPFARTAFIEQTGIHVDPLVVKSNEYPFMMASLDGISRELNYVVEFKCGKSAYDKALNGEVASYYIPQLQHILAVTGLDSIDYCCYWNSDLVIINVPRDDDYIANLIEQEKEFYDCLVNHREPKTTLEDFFEETSEEARMLRYKLENAMERKKSLEVTIDKCKEGLIEIAHGRNIKVDNLKVRKKVRSGSIDYKKIPELETVNLEDYRKESTEYYSFCF
jgi:predicted phage-related endonuclease